MARSEKIKDEAKHVEAELRAIGEHEHADRIRRLRAGYTSAISTLKALHSDNMMLRSQLGLPSFLDAKKDQDNG